RPADLTGASREPHRSTLVGQRGYYGEAPVELRWWNGLRRPNKPLACRSQPCPRRKRPATQRVAGTLASRRPTLLRRGGDARMHVNTPGSVLDAGGEDSLPSRLA